MSDGFSSRAVKGLQDSWLVAWRGGVTGATAMSIQVLTLMWMRTTVNYQYRYGTTTTTAFKTLYRDGGVLRFYRGLLPALVQAPLARFGDTFVNSGVTHFMNNEPTTKDLPVSVRSTVVSVAAAGWRVLLMPLDTIKTIMQVEGENGLKKLATKVRAHGLGAFYHSTLAASTAAFVAQYPWWGTFNALDVYLPQAQTQVHKLLRYAGIGLVATAASDTVSNSVRVLKTYRQTHDKIGYMEAARAVVATDGVAGLFGRGLKTKLVSNGVQGMLFTVAWKYFEMKRAEAAKTA
eukprot:TRINITY_DN3215_c0_g2_i1.p1 TRINITY_DN3215_c0_g2~~TRINITY_DN3215_c0_g2_i1.p1  ORF type:complete len:291 (+),score=63.09 TRINITY_DN3215_c0_g2_i1:1034-1906(+)